MRHDLFGPLHKGLRHFTQSTLLRLGQADGGDRGDLGDALDHLRALLAMRMHHLELEEEIIAPALDARVPGWMLRHEHENHRRALRLLSEEAHALACCKEPASVRRTKKRHLYLHL